MLEISISVREHSSRFLVVSSRLTHESRLHAYHHTRTVCSLGVPCLSFSFSDLNIQRSGRLGEAPFSTPSSMAPRLKLFVFIIGFDSSFSVNIESSESIDDLKESILIKNPDELKGVGATRLTLYQVQLPDDETLEQSALQAWKHPGKKKLFPSQRLSEIFPTDPPARIISILVDIGE